ncbi:NAD(P)H-dependent oxidoreductase [Wenzhouxiangella marina]|uniref:NAD(P)H dehydrogenase (Quinone) n=1 Tax=Wenzhouxiangella marina TaxID=1579979 RepID=A0A0K0XW22_9GAMM|nr:NAD(P)H-dependent oxidoreductase [Wenzhouxiangella marina]AKS41904.1 NAD(P)H dehydrogenase (Quinone) [Wenzhouxiangella marina]MBB6086329.1 putative NADPH-quinone reductase [Wenzhouxiangella marina]
MPAKVLIIQAHPDPRGGHFCHALAAAYREAAEGAGHRVEQLDVASLDIPPLESESDWNREADAADVRAAQAAILEADHLVFVFPLWMGMMPAVLKAFLEQVLRPGFAFAPEAREGFGERKLKGKSARIIITMGMPGLFYRGFYRAHAFRAFKRNILKFSGIKPVRGTFIGLVDREASREKGLARVRDLGRRGV